MSGGLARVNEDSLEDFLRIIDDPNDFQCDTEARTALFHSLLRGGYIIGENINELDILKTKSQLGRFNSEHFHLTIMPTLDCNFKCVYCYEKPKPGVMTRETQGALIKWVERKVRTCQLFTVSWFGGEPLLALDCVKNLGLAFRSTCEKHGVKYDSSITTNGYLMNEEVVSELDNLGIKSVQVTIDGPPDIHNKTRVLKDGRGTYHVLIKNLGFLIRTREHIRVYLRVNCSSETIHEIPRFYDDLPDCIKKRANIYLAEIYSCASFVGQDSCAVERPVMSDDCRSSAKLKKQIMEMELLCARLHEQKAGVRITTKYVMRPKTGYCEADFANHFVVDPQGGLFKCTVSFPPELKVGQIQGDGTATFDLTRLAPWLAKDPFERKKCRACKILPICMGGCNSSFLNDPSAPGCATPISPREVKQALKMLCDEGVYHRK
jgi:uncharacterized protein